MSVHMQDFVLTELFLEMMMEWNNGRTRNLVLRGNDLSKKVGRRIQDGDLLRIIPFLAKHEEIVSLDLPYNEIGNCGLYNMIMHIKRQPTIKYLNMIGNRIEAHGIRHLVSLAENLPFLVLRLSGNKIGNEGGRLLSELLYMNIPLKVLDVSDCHMTMSGVAHILAALMSNRDGAAKLEVIDIGRPLAQSYHQMCDAHAAEFFGQILHRNEDLKEFHAQQYQLDFRDMEIFVDGLMMNRSLKLLNLNNNNIGDEGVDYLCTYLRTNPPLSGLMIGNNNFGDKGARSLGFNLPYSNVKLLDVSNNHIGDTGILDILYSIRKAEPMKTLFIWGNRMTHTSLVVINLFLTEGVLDQERLDIKLYFTDDGFRASWNSSANVYSHKFYCVSDYGHLPMRKILKIPGKPEVESDVTLKHHVDDNEVVTPCLNSIKLKSCR